MFDSRVYTCCAAVVQGIEKWEKGEIFESAMLFIQILHDPSYVTTRVSQK